MRDLLAGQGWYDLHQYRIAPPDGALMHWSRIVDAPLWLSMQLLEPIFGTAWAEQIAMFAIPLLVFLLIMLVVGRLAWRQFDTETAIFACLALGLCPLVLKQVQPMRIDHHSYQLLAVAVAAWAISWRSAWRGGLAAGAALGVGVMVSLETLTMVAGVGAILALRWFRDDEQRWWLTAYMKGLALTLAVVFMLTRGLPDLAEHCDVISPAHIGFFVITALGTGAIAACPQLPRGPLFAAFAVAGAIGLAFFSFAAPQCLGAPFSNLDPLVHDLWYMNVSEGMPIWHHSLDEGLPPLAQAIIALGASLAIAARQRDWLRQWWLEYSLLLAMATLAGVMTFRSFAFAGVVGAVPLGWLIRQLLLRLRHSKRFVPKLASTVFILIALMPGAPITLARNIAPGEAATELETHGASEGASAASSVVDSTCGLYDQAPVLNHLKTGTIFAPLDLGPAILLKTDHSVVATSHHRAEMAMHDVIEAYISDEARAHEIIKRRNADYVVLCDDLTEPQLYSRRGGTNGFMTLLMNGRAPEWLEPLDIGAPPSLHVWQVKQAGNPSPTR
ncbi:hypothetical protein [Altererythrobacter sp.]|uniref:hypothetical protein n=1 Tax=Altererythrobacter sp. TaxID=1872480 RepID=UPI003D0204B7